ncbi:MAG: hypothetical protein LBI95_02890 [Holosporales bacterium]|jgi:putative ABC transport system permease protein|nr:hypothetical protein [Holosporales bacterium]
MLNIQEIVTSSEIGLIYGIMAIGIYLTFRTLNFPDLTCDGSFVFGAIVSSLMIKLGCGPYIALILSMIAGGVAGLCTGILNVCFKIEDLLSGIIVAFMLYSVNLRILGMNPSIILSDQLTIFTNNVSSLQILMIVFLIVLALSYMLNTDIGLALRATGQNKLFTSSCGVNANLMVIFGLMLSNALIGFSGAVFSQYQGFCDVSQGVGSLVIGLASVIIGESIVKFRNVTWAVIACIIGSVIYRIFVGFAIHSDVLGLKTQDLNLVTGIMIIAMMVKKKCCR